MILLPWQPWRNREVFVAPSQPASGVCLSDITVLIPARDEAELIAATISALAEQGHGLKIILIDDHSADGTEEAALAVGCPGLSILPGKSLPEAWSGKLWALQQGFAKVDTPLTLLLDADITLAPGTLYGLRRFLQEQELGMVSLMAQPCFNSVWEKLLMPAFVFFFKLLYPFHLANSNSTRVAAAAGGCVLIETRLLKELDGFSTIKSSIIDDCALAKQVKSLGVATWIGLSHDAISRRSDRHLAGIWKMVARTAYTQLAYSPVLLVFCTLSMLLLYWVPVLGMLVAAEPMRWLALAALALMWVAYLPTLHFYQRSYLWVLSLPVVAGFYLGMTWDSALRYWKGERARWKGRIYGSSDELESI